MKQSILTLSSVTVLMLGLMSVPAFAQEDDATDEAAAAPKTHTIERGDLVLRFDQEGRIDSGTRVKVRVGTEGYRGKLEISRLGKTQGFIAKGDMLFILDAQPVREELEKALMSLDHARNRLDLLEIEQRLAVESDTTRLERSEKSKDSADRALEIWERFGNERMLKTAALSIEGRQNSLSNQKEELKQLESMYEGTRLASETKDIVLGRTRRSVRMSEDWLGISRNDDTVTREYRHPDQDMSVNDQVRYKGEDLEHTRVRNGNNIVRRSMELEKTERGLRDAEEKAADLKGDVNRMTVTADASGIMTTVRLNEGDSVTGQQVVTEILDPRDLIVDLKAEPADLRVIAQGGTVTLTLPAFPEVQLTGVIDELALIGSSGNGTTHFPMRIRVQGSDPLVRIGLRARAVAERVVNNVLLVPVEAVTMKDGVATCTIMINGEEEERTVRVGAKNEEFYQIVDGLIMGDEVVLGGE